MIKKDWQKIFIPALIIIILSFIAHGLFIISIERPVIYYEYLAIPLLFTFFPNQRIRFLLLTLILLADSIISLSRFYFFDTFNYLSKIPSLFKSHFSFSFWVILIIGIIISSLLVFFTTRSFHHIKSDLPFKKFYLKFLVISFLAVYCIDIARGDSYLYYRTLEKNHTNFSQSFLIQYYKDAKLFSKKYSPVSAINDYPNNSITYKYLKNDSSDHQMLILLESWGYINESLIRTEQINKLLNLKIKGYEVAFDSSTFSGGTSQAEARELLNKTGEAYYSIIQNHQLNVKSMIEIKSDAGYYTTALQSFSGSHSSGYWFRKTLGFNTIKELRFFADTLHRPINFNNHYDAINDEDVFEYGMTLAMSHKKSFTYILTINTHLPFKGSVNKNIISANELKSLPSEESLDQYVRLKEQFNKIAILLEKYPINKLVIIGDHPPPFLKPTERGFYSTKLVPAVIISKSN
jgi:hypothetical protein